MKSKVNRIMIVGTGSGCGKTTVTMGLLKALKNSGMTVSSFKCGPDYIDPMFHSEIIGAKSRNLDLSISAAAIRSGICSAEERKERIFCDRRRYGHVRRIGIRRR